MEEIKQLDYILQMTPPNNNNNKNIIKKDS